MKPRRSLSCRDLESSRDSRPKKYNVWLAYNRRTVGALAGSAKLQRGLKERPHTGHSQHGAVKQKAGRQEKARWDLGNTKSSSSCNNDKSESISQRRDSNLCCSPFPTHQDTSLHKHAN